MIKKIIRGTVFVGGVAISVHEGIAAGKITKKALDNLVDSEGKKDDFTKGCIAGVVGSEVTTLSLTGVAFVLKLLG